MSSRVDTPQAERERMTRSLQREIDELKLIDAAGQSDYRDCA